MLYRHVFDKISTEFRGIFRVFVNFAGFRGFTWISRLRDRAKYQKPWNTHLFLGWWRWGLHYLLCNRLSITMTFKFFLIEFEDAREYNLSHILYSCVTAAESWFEDNSLVLPNSIFVFFQVKANYQCTSLSVCCHSMCLSESQLQRWMYFTLSLLP